MAVQLYWCVLFWFVGVWLFAGEFDCLFRRLVAVLIWLLLFG